MADQSNAGYEIQPSICWGVRWGHGGITPVVGIRCVHHIDIFGYFRYCGYMGVSRLKSKSGRHQPLRRECTVQYREGPLYGTLDLYLNSKISTILSMARYVLVQYGIDDVTLNSWGKTEQESCSSSRESIPVAVNILLALGILN